jgi:hypothetical protein
MSNDNDTIPSNDTSTIMSHEHARAMSNEPISIYYLYDEYVIRARAEYDNEQ